MRLLLCDAWGKPASFREMPSHSSRVRGILENHGNWGSRFPKRALNRTFRNYDGGDPSEHSNILYQLWRMAHKCEQFWYYLSQSLNLKWFWRRRGGSIFLPYVSKDMGKASIQIGNTSSAQFFASPDELVRLVKKINWVFAFPKVSKQHPESILTSSVFQNRKAFEVTLSSHAWQQTTRTSFFAMNY